MGCASIVWVGEYWYCGATLVFRGQLKCVGTCRNEISSFGELDESI